jgi:ABC-type multidrug transport system fused ATPase/permease subunit
MKTEHHHKVANDNALTRAWAGVVERFKGPKGRTYWLLLSVVVLVAVLVGVWVYVAYNSASVSSELWTQVMKLSAPQELETFADAHKGTAQARYALLKLARRYMADVDALNASDFGVPDLRRRTAAVEQVRKARDTYAKVADESGAEPQVLQEALLGAGKASETLGDLDAARSSFTRLAGLTPETAPVKEAKDHLALLDDSTKTGEPPMTPSERMRSFAEDQAKNQ